nr:hypothetical protein [uncultured Undibacterium sp.]
MKRHLKTQLLIGILTIGTSFTSWVMAESLANNSTKSDTIKAKRLNTEEQSRHDQEQANYNIQKVIITAKRLSSEEKITYDKEVLQ